MYDIIDHYQSGSRKKARLFSCFIIFFRGQNLLGKNLNKNRPSVDVLNTVRRQVKKKTLKLHKRTGNNTAFNDRSINTEYGSATG
jgi:hypothetical protein